MVGRRAESTVVGRLCLGTVKLGMPWYGVGSVSWPDHREAQAILRTAYDLGIRYYDTGRAYGDAEDLLAQYLPSWRDVHVTTKSAPDLWPYAVLNHVGTLLVHNPSPADCELLGPLRPVESGRMEGASVYTPEEARAALACGARYLQVPYCVLDQRHANVIVEAQAMGATVAVRQPFLQGILTNPEAAAWRPPFENGAVEDRALRRRLTLWVDACRAHRIDFVEAALRFALETPADVVVFGVGSVAHLREVVAVAQRAVPETWPALCHDLRQTFSETFVELRSLWRAS